MRVLFIIFFLSNVTCAQIPSAPTDLKMLGTRTWIRLEWKDNAANENGFKVYWSSINKKPDTPEAVVEANKTRYYIHPVNEETAYYVWVESYNSSGASKALEGKVTTAKKWTFSPDESKELDIPSSAAVPAGMQLFWHDEFNDELLNRNKWSTNYYSTIDFYRGENMKEMLDDSLPPPAYTLNGRTINLFVDSALPAKAFDVQNNKKISSIQTYDWRSNENLLDNSRGGYFEVRVKRSSTGHPKGLNTAFWFDSPGPDLKYYLEKGTNVKGTQGVRPSGQAFEVDVFENLDAQFVIHGQVDKNGNFIHNLATDIARGYQHVDNWVTHGMLWTPSSIKHYINGTLIKEYVNNQKIYSPNHFMNVLLGSYGAGGTVNMEVDYIRYYQWPLTNENELPDGGGECSNQLFPRGGTATISSSAKRSGNNGFLLEAGQSLFQYVYLENSKKYSLKFWAKGPGSVEARADNITPVSGSSEDSCISTAAVSSSFSQKTLYFKTGAEYGNNMKTVKISFTNSGKTAIKIDDIALRQTP